MGRAVDICLLLLFVNLGIGAMAGQIAGEGLYGGGDAGMTPGEAGENASLPGTIPGVGGVGNFLTNPYAVYTLVGAFIAVAALGGVFTNASLTRLLGMSLFAGIFWWVWSGTSGILTDTLAIPGWFMSLLTAIYGVVFVLGIMELSSGMRQEGY